MKRLALLAFFMVAACGTATVQAHTVSLAFKAGDTYKYKYAATSKQTAGVNGMSVPVDLTTGASETVTVKSVDSAGVADLTIALSNFSIKTVAGGVTNTTTGTPTASVGVKVRPDGTVVAVDGSSVTASSPLEAFAGVGGGFFITAVLPTRPVKPGDTWTKSYSQTDPNGAGTIQITSNSTYLRDETIGGVSAAVVETKSTGTISMSSASSGSEVSVSGGFTTDVTTWIDPGSHRIIKSHSTSTDDLTINLPAGGSSAGQLPITGPLTVKGTGTADVKPA